MRAWAWDDRSRWTPSPSSWALFLVTLAFWDLFETVVVPRPTPGWFRIGRYVVRGSWRALRAIRDGRRGRSYDTLLGLFAPAVDTRARWSPGSSP